MTTIDRVLACPTLPSLPAVAVEVLALTREPHVSLAAISKVVQNDPGLAAKILKTVNSSFYGLQQPCSRLDRAMSYLGLQAVKSLVLGFSLVDATRAVGNEPPVDLKRHWRRTIFAASAARHLAHATKATDADEVFACALFQDIGVLACVAALGEEYIPTLATAPDDHDLLCRHEREVFPFDHTTVGSELARKWKLPDMLVESIRKHHTPDSAGLVNAGMVRITALSMYVAEALSTPGAAGIAARLGQRGHEWFGITPETMSGLLRSTATSATELAKLFEQDVAIANAGVIMAEAQEAILNGQLETQREADRLKIETCTDTLTNIWNRRKFDRSLAEEFTRAKEERRSLTVLFLDADRFKSVNDSFGHSVGDEVLREIARRIDTHIGEGGTVCRYGGEEFAVIMPATDGVRAREAAELLRRAIADAPIDLTTVDGAPANIVVTVSVGIATMEAGSGSAIESPEQLVALADQAVYGAKSCGRNCVRVASASTRVPEATHLPAVPRPPSRVADSPRTLEAAGSLRSGDGILRILVVDDDPLAGKLLSMIFQRLPQTEVRLVLTGNGALQMLGGDKPYRPSLAIVDQNLPDTRGVDLIRELRALAPSLARVALITATPTQELVETACTSGADFFSTKADMGGDIAKWVRSVLADTAKAA